MKYFGSVRGTQITSLNECLKTASISILLFAIIVYKMKIMLEDCQYYN